MRRGHTIGGAGALGGCRLESHPFPPTRLVHAGSADEAISKRPNLGSSGNILPPTWQLRCFYGQPISANGAAETAIEKTPPAGVAVTKRLPSMLVATDLSEKAPNTPTWPVTSGGM